MAENAYTSSVLTACRAGSQSRLSGKDDSRSAVICFTTWKAPAVQKDAFSDFLLTLYLQENSIKGRLDKGEFPYQALLDISVKTKTADSAETLVHEILTACNPIMENL